MSKIEWTEKTWNPITGCKKVSPGCKHCYAETLAKRLQAMKVPGYQYGFIPALQEQRLVQPLMRKKPTMYFVCSMSDLFQEDVPFRYVDRVFNVIRRCPQHTFQILTKRSMRMRLYFETRIPPANAWIGVSVENQVHGFPRIWDLKMIPNITVRFLSIEPLLENLGPLNLRNIHWVIVGGESGPGARPMRHDWVSSIHDQCRSQGVPFFFKQWGGRNKKKTGRLLYNREWNEMPERFHP